MLPGTVSNTISFKAKAAVNVADAGIFKAKATVNVADAGILQWLLK